MSNNNSVQVDNQDISISPTGLLLKNGTRKVEPFLDKQTGYLAFEIYDYEAPNRVGQRYVHVEVFRAFSGIPNIPRLDYNDVEIIDNSPRPKEQISNLQLSQSGFAKVYGRKGSPPPPPSSNQSMQADSDALDPGWDGEFPAKQTPPPPAVSDESFFKKPASTTDSNLKEAPGKATDAKPAEPKEKAEQAAPEAAEPKPEPKTSEAGPNPGPDKKMMVARNGNGNFYFLEDLDGNNLLEELNEGKQVNGKTNVKQIAALHGYSLVWK